MLSQLRHDAGLAEAEPEDAVRRRRRVIAVQLLVVTAPVPEEKFNGLARRNVKEIRGKMGMFFLYPKARRGRRREPLTKSMEKVSLTRTPREEPWSAYSTS